MPIRSSSLPTVCEVDVNLPCRVLDRGTMSDLYEAFVMHILFMRGQIPEPFMTMQAKYSATTEEDSRLKFKMKSANRKTRKFLDGITSLLNSVRDIFLNAPRVPDEVSLLLGASALNPRETFTIRFSSENLLVEGEDDDGESVPERKSGAIKRRMLRELVTKWLGGEGDGRARLLNVFAAVHLPQQNTHTLPTLGVLRRVEGFRLKQRRRAPARLLCSLQPEVQPLEEQSDSGSESEVLDDNAVVEEGIWLVSRNSVHALRVQNSVTRS